MHRPAEHFPVRFLRPLALWGMLAFTASGQTGPSPAVAPTSSQPASNRHMAERLAAITKAVNPLDDPFLSTEQVAVYRQMLTQAGEPARKADLMPKFGQQLLNAGLSEEALRQFDQLLQYAQENQIPMSPRNRDAVNFLRAVSSLRIGEQENCLANHNADSCLFPIRGGGVHQLPRGSLGAVKMLTELLTRRPNDLKSRWLLNLAYMTLGRYPDQVPPQWLLPPKLFESEQDFPRFPDAAPSLGLDVFGLAGGVILEDFDGDGCLDLMVSNWALDGQLRLFHNNGDGSFSERTSQAWLTGLTGGLNIQQTDYNNDGRPDVFILRGAWLGKAGHYPKSLLRNNGDGTFTDVTEEAGLLSPHPTQTATWFDYDGDGWLDVFIGNETNGDDANPCELYHNNHDGTFTECAARCGLAVVGFIKAVASDDFNNDGRPDLYLSNRGGRNLLFRNDGPRAGGGTNWIFTDVTAKAGVDRQQNSFPTWFFDYDNDGWPDILVSGYNIKDVGDICADYLGLPTEGERARLYHNNHDGTFTDVTREAGLYKIIHAMGCNFGDLDNDGWLDAYFGAGDPALATLIPHRMFRNDGGKRFLDVSNAGGFGQLQKGHAIAFGDIDNDGDQDIYSVVGGAYSGDLAYSQLFLNPGNTNHWITLKLEGRESNRIALGARIKVNTVEGGQPRAIYRTVSTGGSFGSSPLRQEIGLGQASAIASVEIFWPTTGKTQTLTGLERDRFYKIREGDAAATPWDLKPIRLNLAAPKHTHAVKQPAAP